MCTLSFHLTFFFHSFTLSHSCSLKPIHSIPLTFSFFILSHLPHPHIHFLLILSFTLSSFSFTLIPAFILYLSLFSHNPFIFSRSFSPHFLFSHSFTISLSFSVLSIEFSHLTLSLQFHSFILISFLSPYIKSHFSLFSYFSKLFSFEN